MRGARLALAGLMLVQQTAESQTAGTTGARVAAFEVSEASIAELQAALASGRTTSVALVRAYRARIAAYEQAGPALNALIRVNANAEREAAVFDAERKAGKVRGPLHGIPVIVKDNYDTHDMPTTAGALAMANSQPARDAFVVRKLRAAGAIILAKSNLHELAAGITTISSLGGQTRNPYDPARCPGGSSGGTGAAIAASFAAVGWGSDTCGSIRIPSAFASLVGLRPTQGLVSRSGIVPLSHTQDIAGPLARTVADLAIALDVTVGADPDDADTRVLTARAVPNFTAALDKNALRGARIGVFLPYFRDTDAEIADTVRSAIAALRAQGATVVDVAMPEFDTLMANTTAINMETKGDLERYLATIPNVPVRTLRDILARGGFDRQLEVRLRTADTFPTTETDAHRTVLARQAALRARMTRILDSLQLDAIAYPAVRQKPVFPGEVQAGSTCNLSAQSGLPAIAMQAGFTSDGLPVGLELLGAAFSDTKLVAYAYTLEQAGVRRRAPVSTPALVAGRAPVVAPIVVANTAGTLRAATSLTFDDMTRTLRWRVTVTGAASDAPVAVVLRRRGGGTISGVASSTIGSAPTVSRMTIPDSATRVVVRLAGPDARSASGSVPLTWADRTALNDGKLSVQLLTRSGATNEQPVVPKRP